ncbi:hypothetical protein EDC04DRAFT_2613277 [Pisolithus marmoratus]|nr:hypothetical protein EDC04DRAFT_2613277 [Pisolithus marmoratus]
MEFTYASTTLDQKDKPGSLGEVVVFWPEFRLAPHGTATFTICDVSICRVYSWRVETNLAITRIFQLSCALLLTIELVKTELTCEEGWENKSRSLVTPRAVAEKHILAQLYGGLANSLANILFARHIVHSANPYLFPRAIENKSMFVNGGAARERKEAAWMIWMKLGVMRLRFLVLSSGGYRTDTSSSRIYPFASTLWFSLVPYLADRVWVVLPVVLVYHYLAPGHSHSSQSYLPYRTSESLPSTRTVPSFVGIIEVHGNTKIDGRNTIRGGAHRPRTGQSRELYAVGNQILFFKLHGGDYI